MMTTSKTKLFDQDLQIAATFFKALSHPARLAILTYLSGVKVCMTGDITNELPLSRSTVNQHLSELKDTGLIKGEISGVKVNYCLNKPRILEMKKHLDSLIRNLENCAGDDC